MSKTTADSSASWEAEPHTLAKHAILKNYLDAWAAIFSRTPGVQELNFYDGFAGRGEYIGGEPGSPIVAINALLANTTDLRPVRLRFTEIDPETHGHLASRIKAARANIPAGSPVRVEDPTLGDCNEEILKLIATYKAGPKALGPALFFLDQFGYSQVPMALIREIMNHRRYAEVFTYLNCLRLVPYLTDAAKAPTITAAFGDESWRVAIAAPDPREAMIAAYQTALRKNGKVRYPWAFSMYDEVGRLIYWLVFCTNDLKGLEVMKKAMWKVDASGAFRFSDRVDPRQQLLFFSNLTDEWLADKLAHELRGRTMTKEELHEYVLTRTPFFQYLEMVNKILRKDGRVMPKERGKFPITFAV